MRNKQKFGNLRIDQILAALFCCIGLLGFPNPAGAASLSETSAPAIITQLATAASSTPQISIITPRPEEVLPSGDVAVNLQVSGIAIFKNAALGLGPHLHLLLDGTPRSSVYDLSQPVMLNDLPPGTHTLEVLANKPWHESWKNPGALAQVTFHILAKSAPAPNPLTPRLVFVPPANFGAEPFLLDFYLTNPPSHPDSQGKQRSINDWQVRATINNQSFMIDRWQPFYLKGLNSGANLIKLEYLDAQGQVLDSSIRILTYQPNGSDSFARLLRNELPLANGISLFDPSSRAVATPAAVTVPSPIAAMPVSSPMASPIVPVVVPSLIAVPTMPVVPPRPIAVPTIPIVPPSPIAVLPNPTDGKASEHQPQSSGQQETVAVPVPAVVPSSIAVPTMPVVVPTTIPSPIVVVPAPVPISPAPQAILPAPPQPVALPVINPVPSPIGAVPLPIEKVKTLAPAVGEDVVEFKVILQELWHTTVVRVKQFTNQIPPLVAKWSQDFSHWVGDRMQAMRQPAPITTTATEAVSTIPPQEISL